MKHSILRHVDIINPNNIGAPVHIIGVGATGSHLAYVLTKIGIRNLHLWDMDTVEAHNVANQFQTNGNVGQKKTESIVSLLDQFVRLDEGDVILHDKEFDPETDKPMLSGHVFLMVDSMDTRKQIVEKALQYNPRIIRVYETRMDVRMGSGHSFDPNSCAEVQNWHANWYPDSAVVEETSACGASQTMLPTVFALVGLLAWEFVHAVNEQPVDQHLVVGLDRPMLEHMYPTMAEGGA